MAVVNEGMRSNALIYQEYDCKHGSQCGTDKSVSLNVILLTSILGVQRHTESAPAAEIPQPVVECPCVGQYCMDFQDCVCLQSRTSKACTCSCPEQRFGIPEDPLPRVSCACEGFTCAQGQNALCTEAQLWPPIKCSCSFLKRGPLPPRQECPCGAYSCNKGEKCDCDLTKPKGTYKCSCYPEFKPPRVNCAECKGYSCSPGERCACAKVKPFDPAEECKCGEKVDLATGAPVVLSIR